MSRPVTLNFPDSEKPNRMSENENKTPSKQTSSVPLKKETVRVTLKAADAPPAMPSATLPASPAPTIKPPTPPIAPPAPSAVRPPMIQPPSGAPTAMKPPAPAPTIPLRTAGPPTMGAPTIRLATSNVPVGAPTIALKTANIPLSGTGAPTIALKTANTPLPVAGAATVSLPKATVALNPPTKPLSPIGAAVTQKPTLSTLEEAEDETGADTFAKVLASVGLVAALVVLGIQLKISSIWIGAEDNVRNGEWSLLLE